MSLEKQLIEVDKYLVEYGVNPEGILMITN